MTSLSAASDAAPGHYAGRGWTAEPAAFERRILVSAVGLTPQVVTETLFALVVEGKPSFLPTEIHLVTTREGAHRARLTLLDDTEPQLAAFGADYGCSSVSQALGEDRIHVIPGSDGQPLDDIASLEDNVAAADFMTALMRGLTQDAGAALHVSIAGGRKTMSFLLGYALSLFGRPQDRLSHVLVDEPFQSHPQFFFPPRRPRVLFAGNRPVRTDDARIVLADIPFVRLRHGLSRALLHGAASYSATVGRLQDWLKEPEMVIDEAERRLACHGRPIRLSPLLFAWIVWFARRCAGGLPDGGALHWSEARAGEFLAEYRALFGAHSDAAERIETALSKGMTQEYFEQKKAALNRALRDALGPLAQTYCLAPASRVPHTRYTRVGLALEPQQIRFVSGEPDTSDPEPRRDDGRSESHSRGGVENTDTGKVPQ